HPSPPHLYTLSLHDALPISTRTSSPRRTAASVRSIGAVTARPSPASPFGRAASDSSPTAKVVESSCLPSSLRAGALRSFLAGERSEEHTSELQSRFDLVCRL